MEKINIRYKRSRRYIGLTQQEVADVLKTSQKAISFLENEIKKYSKYRMEYALFLYKKGIDLNWLYTGKGEMIREDFKKNSK